MKKKLLTMKLTVAVPANMSPREARREARFLVNTGTGWGTHPGEALKVRKVEPA